MGDPIEFFRAFQALLHGRGIAGVLTSGMACVEYGLQQNTKDTDWIVHPADIDRLVELFFELERGVSGANWRVSYRGLFGAPLDAEYLAGGWTSHLAVFESPEAAEPFAQQHRRVGEAVRQHGLPPAPLATAAARQAVYDRGRKRAAGFVAATPEEMTRVAMPLDMILV